jgi:hypothetical protein
MVALEPLINKGGNWFSIVLVIEEKERQSRGNQAQLYTLMSPILMPTSLVITTVQHPTCPALSWWCEV